MRSTLIPRVRVTGARVSGALLAIAAAALSAAAVRPALASADVVLATGLPSDVKVSMAQRADAVAWSERRPDGRWKLVIRLDGRTSDANAASSARPFDVDLGDDGRGHLIATYSRCAPTSGLLRPRGCDVYRYAVTAGRERRVRGLGYGTRSDYLPTAASGRIAFARSINGGPARLYRRALDGGRLRRLPGGLSNRDPRTGPRSLDLGRRGLAIAWRTLGPAGFDYGYGAKEARYDPLRGGTRLLARYVQGDISGTDVVGASPVDLGGGVFWGAQGNGEDVRSRLYLIPREWESSDSRYLNLPLDSVSGTSLDRAVVLSCPRTTEDVNACSVVLLS